MRLFLSMLLSGNLLFLCFLISITFGGKHLGIRWKSDILKLCLFFSIVPIAFFVSLLKSCIISLMHPIIDTKFVLSGRDTVLILSPNGFDMTVSLKTEIGIIALWIFIGICIFVYRIFRYLVQRKHIAQSMVLMERQVVDEILKKYAKDLKLPYGITLYINSARVSPFTTGIWRPMIAVPAGLNPSDHELVILHELCHIKNRDNVYGFIRLFTLSLYWFNPLVYIMDYQIEKTAELRCDEMVLALGNEIDKSAYCHLIVEMAGLNYKNKTYAYSFSQHGKNVKERVMNILNTNQTTKEGRVCSVVLAGCMILCSSIPVLAYQPPKMVEIQSTNHMPVSLQSNFVFEFQTSDEPTAVDNITFDRQFTDINGQFYSVENLDGDERFGCDQHNYVSGTLTIHELNNDGRCSMEYCHAERCSKCGFTIAEDLYKSVTYVKCSH